MKEVELEFLNKCKYTNLFNHSFNLFSIWVNVVTPDGIPRRYASTKGESLLDVLDRNRTAGIYSDCNGGDQEFTFSSH